MDDKVHFCHQALPVGIRQAQAGCVHVAPDHHYLGAHVQGHSAVLPVQVEQVLGQ